MKRRWRMLLVVAGCGVVAAVALMLSREREPEYKGRTLSEWLLALGPGPWPVGGSPPIPRTAGGRDMADALRHIGTNALPLLIRWVRYEGEDSLMNKLRATAHRKLGATARRAFLLRWLLSDQAAIRASTAEASFDILGAQASPAVPALARLVQRSKAPNTQLRAMRCLVAIGTNGLPPLMAALTDQANQGWVRAEAAWYVALVAAEMKADANPAVPALVQCLNDRDRKAAERAAKALGWLAMEPGVTVPALTNALRNSSREVRYRAAQSLGRFGRRGGAGVPALVNAVNDPDLMVRWAATDALREIDPEALEGGKGVAREGN